MNSSFRFQLPGNHTPGKRSLVIVLLMILAEVSCSKQPNTSATETTTNTPKASSSDASGANSGAAIDPAQKPKSIPVVTTQTAIKETISDLYRAPGVVKGDNLVTVPSFSEGIISHCQVTLGKSVKKGEQLCSINNDNPTATYLPFTVTAPVDGVIGELKVSIGNRISKGEVIATIVRPSQVRVEIEVPVADAQLIKNGSLADWVSNEKNGEAPKQLKVVGISPLPDPITRTVRIELAVQNKENLGPSGTIGKVTFNLNKREGIEIAEEALQYRGTEPFLRTIQEGKIIWQPVGVGRIQSGKAEITKGIAIGATIVIASPKYLVDGDEVTVQKEKVSAK